MAHRSLSAILFATLAILAAVGIGRLIAINSLAAALVPIRPDISAVLDPANGELIFDAAEVAFGLKTAMGEDQLRSPPENETSRAQTEMLKQRGIAYPLVAPALSDGERDYWRRKFGDILIARPISARALRLLALAAPNPERQTWLMRISAELSKHEALALFWMMQDAFVAGDMVGVIQNADMLMRGQPQFSPLVMPFVVQCVVAPRGLETMHVALARDPPYRWAFFNELMRSQVDPRLPLDLLVAMQRAGVEPEPREVALYVQTLLSARNFQLAQYAWLYFVPEERLDAQLLLFNGKFQYPPSGMPFDWMFEHRGGLRIEIADAPGKVAARALRAEFTEGQADGGAFQMLTLPPGSYVLTGSANGLVRARRGLVWRVSCIETRRFQIAETDLLREAPQWQPFSLNFTVPAAECGAQRLELLLHARSDSEKLASGSMYFTDLDIAAQ